MANQQDDMAPQVSQFGNPMTGPILVVLIVSLLMGFINCWFGLWISGLILVFVCGYIIQNGWTTHTPEKPKQVGLIEIWDRIYRVPESGFSIIRFLSGITGGVMPNGTIVVEGSVILLNIWPFNMNTIKIDVGNKDIVFEFDALTNEDLPVHIKISTTGKPDITDLPDYIQAGGNHTAIEEQIREIVIGKARQMCSTKSFNEIFQGALTVEMQSMIEDLFCQRKFGWKIKKVQIIAELPEEIRDAKIDTAREMDQRKAEAREYETMRMEARKIQLEDARPFVPGILDMNPIDQDREIGVLIGQRKVRNFDKALDTVKGLRLTRDGRVARIESTGGAGQVNLVDTNLNMGGKGKK
jgi:hypothetical protein